jgi:glutaminase
VGAHLHRPVPLRRSALELDDDVDASEADNNLRNQGIAHLLDSAERRYLSTRLGLNLFASSPAAHPG